jgi:alpha-tubulin suppressor-like RCC1 family protein
MRGVNDLITKINTIINSGTATETDLINLSGALDSLKNKGVVSVASPGSLPNPVENKGRFIYVRSTSQYTFSNGIVWDINTILRTLVTPMWTMGTNTYGQLGDNTTVAKSSPVSVVGGINDWIQVSGGQGHSISLRANGTAWAWGRNQFGQMGNGTTVNRSSPLSVVGGFTDWVQISAGTSHSAAVRANGTAWGWGLNSVGQIGDNTTVAKSSPVSVASAGFTEWVQISAGHYHTAALRANGSAWAWGQGTNGQLGDGTTVNKSSPVSVVGGFTDWVQISAGRTFTAAVRASGTAWAWGYGGQGRLGDNTSIGKSSPVSVVGGFTDWVQISAGGNHTAAIRANGTAWAWGFGFPGSIGDGTIVDKSSPVSVVGGFTDWVQIVAGYRLTAAIRANGTAWAWGQSERGIGDGTTVNRSSPVSLVGGFTDWIQIDHGEAHTIAVRAT